VLSGALWLGHLNILGLGGSSGWLLVEGRLYFFTFLLNVSENVVQDEESAWLSGKDESLSDDLNNDVFLGALGIDVGDANLAFLEIKSSNTLLNLLLRLEKLCIGREKNLQFVRRQRE